VFYDYGELKNAPVFANNRWSQRVAPNKTTDELKKRLLSFAWKVGNKVLAQIYQAIRIEVNQEMDVLKEFLEQSWKF
jgi:16S rRNA (cytosine1402-N4)-methyltransferase